MAEGVLFVSWGQPVAGREERGLEVFNEALGFYGKCQQDGRIESFDVVLLEPNADMNGYIELRGSVEQLNDLREDDEYRRILVEASLVCTKMRVLAGATGARIAREVAMYQDVLSHVPQTT